MTVTLAPIVLGQHVHCILYGGRDGIIVNIRGTLSSEPIRECGLIITRGMADVDIIWNDGTTSDYTPEPLLYSVQWKILPQVATPAAIAAAQARAALRRIQTEAAEHAAAQRLQTERAALPAAHPTLEVGGDRYSGTLAARNIRRQLKAAFPGTTFSVRKRHHGSLTISWTDGPTHAQVEAISNNYASGSFDGSEDIYRNDDTHVWPDVFGGAKYIHTERNYSDALLSRAIDSVWTRFVHASDQIPKPTPTDHNTGRTWSLRLPGAGHDEAYRLISETLATLI